MVLILAHHYDAEASWLFNKLLSECGVAATLVLPEALGIDYNVSLRLRNDGKHNASIFLYDKGSWIDGSTVNYVVNRLNYIEPLLWKQATESERTYATNELNAFFPALIHALCCPVSNRVHYGSLYGDVHFAWRWAYRVKENGIRVNTLVLDRTGKVFEKISDAPRNHLVRLLL